MTFEEACELARIVNGNSRFAVIAIGRFALQTELQAAYRGSFVDKLPWGVSVMAVVDPDYRGVMHNESAWREFVENAPHDKSHDKPSSAATPQQTARKPDPQLSLF